jgi:DNA-3-methyladenine glycosylase
VPRPLARSFFARDTVGVARALLGCVLETRIQGKTTSGRIVEVEAYVGPHDPAAHGYGNRRSARNASIFGPPGTLYVYFIYGMHWCCNAVTEREGYPAAVLLRALEPIEGMDVMRRRRGLDDVERLCSGPAKLCQALGIDRRLDGASLRGPAIRVLPAIHRPRRILAVPRIGIRRAADWPLRFLEEGSRWTSRRAP